MVNASAVTTSDAAQRPKRLSCDRCHSQKVRCTRSESRKTGDCDRCLRKGAKCVYSSCLPKGRPSLYRATETAKSPEQTASQKPRAATSSTASSPDMCSRTDSLEGPMEEIVYCSPTVADDENNAHYEFDASADMGMHDQVFPPFPYQQDGVAGSGPGWGQDEHLHDSMSLDLAETTVPILPALLTRPLSSHRFDEYLVGMPETDSLGSSSIASLVDKQQQGLGISLDIRSGTSASSLPSGQSSVSGSCGISSYAETLRQNMTRLSQLSANSSQLLFFSKTFLLEVPEMLLPREDQDPPAQVYQVIKAVFKSVHSWVARGQRKADPATKWAPASARSHEFLHHVLSASDQLRDILRQLNLTSGARTPAAYPGTAFATSSISMDGEATAALSPQVPHETSQNHSIVCQLVISCASLLLNMYSVAFGALQRCLDMINTSSQGHVTSDEHDERLEASSRAHFQLVSVIQLCSYIFNRQNQAVETLLRNHSRVSRILMLREQESRQSVSFDAITGLKTEVEQQLKQLHQSLYRA
ncbi:Zn(II)2Cys6 transcription factor domain-containing protein [Aspergillus affinis]|uniref:Zn(II)2Cys6 transcription factor domain-containing protein n=1 Tax=Aspergillus affinis TaxID=1070780 RepID=UPI0022FF43B1|nr:uncharacterized protein KD926_005166 [Aspergillus affinis]KAI9034881.1 hypothetical protein KD926_005166 [Aspergillus affinis]